MAVRTFDDVIDRLDAIIKHAEDDGDRIGYFAALYRKFTMGVRDAARSGEFLDGGRMERFDVTFANRYFDALDAYRSGRTLTRTWELSFEACKDERPSILQHLYAGLAAHQLLDLGIAAAEIAPGPRIGDLREDFEHINQIVSRLTREVDLVIGALSPWIGRIERFAGPQYAAFNKLGIAYARDLAWRVALDLAKLEPAARGPRIARVDGHSATIAGTLLRPPLPLSLVARAVRRSEPDDPRAIIRQLRGADTAPVSTPRPSARRLKKKKRIAVLGGGIGGLTAAHELAQRGFDVHVYEASGTVGGKACSQFVAGTGTAGRRDLPGEHGFRFFPSFYRHVTDTMERIPVAGGGHVSDRLRESTEMAMAEHGAGYKFLRHPPRDVGDFFDVTSTIRQLFANTNIPQADVARFAQKMLGYMIACNERRLAIHEKQSFYEFLEGDSYSPVFRKYIATTRFMVAMDPKKASARTVATKGIQILTDFFRNGTHTDAALDGPTSERWIAPWRDELERLGVTFHLRQPIRELMLSGMRLSGVRLASGDTIRADHYVVALPLDRAAPLVSDALANADPALAALRRIGNATSWMVGAQFFLRERFPVCHGHVAFPDSEWSLSSVSQGQFWSESLGRYGNGTVKDILSVDISNWDEPSRRSGKTAKQATSRDEVLDDVWAQLKDALAIDDSILVARHLDENVTFGPNGAENRTPLLVHPPGTWFDRPPADLSIENLFLASDYVKTNTDLASMEGANEAARRAVNAILDTEGLAEPGCTIWSMEEETGPLVAIARRLDRDVFLLESDAGPAITPRFGGVMADLHAGTIEHLDRVQDVTDSLRTALRATVR